MYHSIIWQGGHIFYHRISNGIHVNWIHMVRKAMHTVRIKSFPRITWSWNRAFLPLLESLKSYEIRAVSSYWCLFHDFLQIKIEVSHSGWSLAIVWYCCDHTSQWKQILFNNFFTICFQEWDSEVVKGFLKRRFLNTSSQQWQV